MIGAKIAKNAAVAAGKGEVFTNHPIAKNATFVVNDSMNGIDVNVKSAARRETQGMKVISGMGVSVFYVIKGVMKVIIGLVVNVQNAEKNVT